MARIRARIWFGFAPSEPKIGSDPVGRSAGWLCVVGRAGQVWYGLVWCLVWSGRVGCCSDLTRPDRRDLTRPELTRPDMT